MKHLFLYILVAAISLVLLTCGDQQKPAETKKDDAVQETPVEDPGKLEAETPVVPIPETKEETKRAEPKATQGQTVTIHGELVDLVGYLSSGKSTDPEALRNSARAGNPIGFLDAKTGKIYVVGDRSINESAVNSLMPFIGIRVFLTGKVYSQNGVNVIIMSDIGKSMK